MYFAKSKKPDPKGYRLHDFISTISRKGKTMQMENRSMVAKGEGLEEGVDNKEATCEKLGN